MWQFIENEFLKVGIHPQGAELKSIQSKKTGIEYMWQGDSRYWSRSSCVLFPIVGRLNNDVFRYKGKAYTMKQHGFARDMPFQVVNRKSSEIAFQLESSEATLRQYPFPFRLQVIYTLKKNRLSIRYLVANTAGELMVFSLGAHPGFRCPLVEGESRDAYRFVFEQSEKAYRMHLQEGLFSGETELVLDRQDTIPITSSLFDHDALVFKGLKSNYISLVNGQNQTVLRVFLNGHPYLGLWSKNSEAPFVCIEPWLGCADTVGFEGDFSQKEGVVLLPAFAAVDKVHEIEITGLAK
jgi:galactose mutarotase-like enzyme